MAFCPCPILRERCSFSLRLRRLVRIVEEKLVAVEILDHQQLVAPAAVLDRKAAGFELGAQRVERHDRGLVRLGLDVQGNEHQALADLLRPAVDSRIRRSCGSNERLMRRLRSIRLIIHMTAWNRGKSVPLAAALFLLFAAPAWIESPAAQRRPRGWPSITAETK